MVIHHGSQQIISSRDCVQISREMKVDALHRQHLGIAAAGCAALHAKHRPQAGFPQRQHGFLAASAQAICQGNADGGFSLTGRCGVNGRYQNQLSFFLTLRQGGRIHLRHQPSVEGQCIFRNACFFCNLANGLGYCCLCNFQISCHAVSPPPPMPRCQVPG